MLRIEKVPMPDPVPGQDAPVVLLAVVNRGVKHGIQYVHFVPPRPGFPVCVIVGPVLGVN